MSGLESLRLDRAGGVRTVPANERLLLAENGQKETIVATDSSVRSSAFAAVDSTLR